MRQGHGADVFAGRRRVNGVRRDSHFPTPAPWTPGIVEAVRRQRSLLTLAAAAVLAAAAEPMPAHACSLPPPRAELVAPVDGAPVPPQAVFWFSMRGRVNMGVPIDLDPVLRGPGGEARALVASEVAAPSRPDGVSVSARTFRAEAQLEPGTAYSLTYTSAPRMTVDGEPVRTVYEFTTTAEASSDAPAPPVVELALAEVDGDAPWPFPCSVGEFQQVTVIFAQAPGAAALHARTRYVGERGFSRPNTHTIPPGASGDALFAWAGDRGLPCVEVVAEGPDGRLSGPTVVCEAIACAEGAAWAEGLGEGAAWWRQRYGAASCAGGCACAAVRSEPWAGGAMLGGWVVLLGLRRRRR